ncbi:MAG: hypothetical protein AAF830_10730 [Pseudomonadota bacterium]
MLRLGILALLAFVATSGGASAQINILGPDANSPKPPCTMTLGEDRTFTFVDEARGQTVRNQYGGEDNEPEMEILDHWVSRDGASGFVRFHYELIEGVSSRVHSLGHHDLSRGTPRCARIGWRDWFAAGPDGPRGEYFLESPEGADEPFVRYIAWYPYVSWYDLYGKVEGDEKKLGKVYLDVFTYDDGSKKVTRELKRVKDVVTHNGDWAVFSRDRTRGLLIAETKQRGANSKSYTAIIFGTKSGGTLKAEPLQSVTSGNLRLEARPGTDTVDVLEEVCGSSGCRSVTRKTIPLFD